MSIITFTSDFGTQDHYVAAVKAKIANFNPNVRVVDISHDIDPYDIAHGAYVINAVFRDFPKGTVHLIGIGSLKNENGRYVAVKLEEHYFVAPDNGILSLLSDKTPIVVDLIIDKNANLSFPEKSVLAFAAVSLASGKAIYDLGPTAQQGSLIRNINHQVKISKDKIEGNIIYIDHYGNTISNISKKIFEENIKDKKFLIIFGREHVNSISKSYSENSLGMLVALFNDQGFLEIAVREGSASELFNLRYYSRIHIEFNLENDNFKLL